MTHKVIQPMHWKAAKGYANGMLADDGTLYVGGQVGWNSDQKFESHNFIGQMEQALQNIVEVVEAAGGHATDVVRLTWFVTDKKEYAANQAQIGKAYQKTFGKHFPAMSMLVVSELIEDEALLEIEATAKIIR